MWYPWGSPVLRCFARQAFTPATISFCFFVGLSAFSFVFIKYLNLLHRLSRQNSSQVTYSAVLKLWLQTHHKRNILQLDCKMLSHQVWSIAKGKKSHIIEFKCFPLHVWPVDLRYHHFRQRFLIHSHFSFCFHVYLNFLPPELHQWSWVHLHSWMSPLIADADNDTLTSMRVLLTWLDVVKWFFFHQRKESHIITSSCLAL